MEERKLRIHVLGIPHTRTNLDYTLCAYTQKVFKFCKMMHRRGHTIYHYGVEGSNPECTENVVVVSNDIYNKVYGGHDYRSKFFKFNTGDECYQTFYKNAIIEINKRKQKNDIILPFWGAGVRPICDAEPDLICIEPGIGYGGGSWAKWRVFESYSIMDAYYGTRAVTNCGMRNYDVVIPNYFDVNDFTYNPNKNFRVKGKERYFLFVGRVYDGKGVNIAIMTCRKLGVKLKIAGQLSPEYERYDWDELTEYVGSVNTEQRNELMRNAIASFLPSQYLEPFGGVGVENLLCGTPIITSDWGAFAEYNIHGVTGYRCRTFDDYINAAMACLDGKIDYWECRKQGLKYTLEEIAPKYEKFFNDVLNVYEGKGWYELSETTEKNIEELKLALNN